MFQPRTAERPLSIKRMRVICQREKLRKTNDLTRKHRAVSIYATWLLVQTPATADHVTIGSIATGLLGAACFALPGLLPGLAGVLLLYVSFLLDQVDGEVARYRRRSSLRGVYLDEIRHLVVYSVPVFALGFDASRRLCSHWPLVVSFAGGFALALARIEERLPALLFGERATKLARESADPVQPVTVGGEEAPPARSDSALKSAARTALAASNALYEVLAHQVLILFWFLAAVVLDRGFGLASFQSAFLVALTLATCGALLASVRTRLVPGALEADAKARAYACVEAAKGVA